MQIKQKLVCDGKYSTKWKSELELFNVVYSVYSDAIYQYHATWLGRQSLDIYIPSLKVAIEYQGLQHFEPVEFWGGIEAFEYRKKLDNLKQILCKDNNIKLVEWKYDEPISKVILNKKLANILSDFNNNN